MLDLLVMVPIVVRSPGLPVLRVMVTGCVESPPVHVSVYVCPALTEDGTEVKAMLLWARTADTKVATARDTLKNILTVEKILRDDESRAISGVQGSEDVMVDGEERGEKR